MDITKFVAWWGAGLSTTVFAWDIWKYLHAGPKLRLSVQTGMEMINVPKYEGKTLIIAKATNRGDRPTTLTNLGLLYFEKRSGVFDKRRFSRKKIADRAMVVVSPSTSQPLPFELKPGVEWTGVAEQNKEVEKMATEGKLYMLLYHSHSKPLQQRVNLRL